LALVRNLLRIFFIFLAICLFIPFPALSYQEAAQADDIPWSGYWWPFEFGGLATGRDYRGSPSPLEKYHLITAGVTTGDAINWYKDKYYKPDAQHWEGLCPAFAAAAVQENYSILPSTHENIVFRVGDKKGLLTLCNDKRILAKYASGRTSPVAFHEYLLSYIRDRKEAFIADLYLGNDQVWYFPIYRYEMTTRKSGQTEDVTTTIYYADDGVHPDYIGTQEIAETYYYELYTGPGGEITGGRWTGDSVDDHPDRLVYLISTDSYNPYLDCEKIRAIARARDDHLEMPDNETSILLPGTHNLVLLNEDVYKVQGDSGDWTFLEFVRNPGSDEPINIEITNSKGVVLLQETLSEGESSVSISHEMEYPPLTIAVQQNNYETDPNIYSIFMELKTAYEFHVPYIPKNGPWSGFSITNSGRDNARFMVVTTGADGKPLHTVVEPVDLMPAEKYLFHFSNLPVRLHEYSDTDSLMLISDGKLELVNLFAYNSGPMAGFITEADHTERLIFPEVHGNELWNPVYMTCGVKNESEDDAEVVFRLYYRQGVLRQEISENISARGKMSVRPGSSPFGGVPEGGWMEVLARDPSVSLTGHYYIKNPAGRPDSMETGFALSLSPGYKYVQHITPSTGLWQTMLTLINPNNQENQVVIHPALAGGDRSMDIQLELDSFEKREINISEAFGDFRGEGSQRSILEISGRHPIAGQVRYMADEGDSVSYPLIDAESLSSELIMPHAAYNKGRWWTGVGVSNPGTGPVNIVIEPFDHDGEIVSPAIREITLEAGAYELFTVHRWFPGIADDISFFKIRATEPDKAEIGGFYLIGNADWKNPEVAARSLISGGNM
jgi:hypothetical protein